MGESELRSRYAARLERSQSHLANRTLYGGCDDDRGGALPALCALMDGMGLASYAILGFSM